MSERRSFSPTTLSPPGQLVETEYALDDVAAGALADVAAGGQPVETEYALDDVAAGALADVAAGGQPVETEDALTDVAAGALADVATGGQPVEREDALTDVAVGSPSVGIKFINGVLLATKKQFSEIYGEHCIHNIEMITQKVGMVYRGMMDREYRHLVAKARKLYQAYLTSHQKEMPTEQIVQRITELIQEFTQPFGVSLLIAGWDDDKKRPCLYQCGPSDAFPDLNATVENYLQRNTRLETWWHDKFRKEDAIYTALFILRDFKVQMTKDNIEIGILNEDGFRRLTAAKTKHYLDNIQLLEQVIMSIFSD